MLRYIQEVIEDKYIKSLVNKYKDLLTDDILTTIKYLFYNYGKVQSEEVTQKEVEVMSMT